MRESRSNYRSRVFFTSDPHFNHGNIIKYSNRPGLSEEQLIVSQKDPYFRVPSDVVQKMDNYLLEGINKTVKPDDILYLLGDFCFADKYNYFQVASSYRNKINCKNIHFIFGNHDRFEIGRLFSSSYNLDQIKIEGQEIVLCHYALAVWNKSHRGSWNLYGHSHANAEEHLDKIFPNRKSMDVGVDNAARLLGEYRPFSFEEIQEIMKNRQGCSIDHHN